MKLIQESLTLPACYTVPETTLQARNGMLGEMDRELDGMEAVETAEALVVVNQQGVELQRHIQEVKATRLQLARPLNTAADLLLATEREYLAPLMAAKARREALVSDYRRRERLRIEAEEQERRAQIEKLEMERRAAEEAAKKTAKGKQSIAAQVQAEQAAHEAKEAQEALIRAPLPAPVAVKGSRYKSEELQWRLTDIHALYAARPDLCNPPTPKASAIKATCHPDRAIPGLELWFEDRSSFSSRCTMKIGM